MDYTSENTDRKMKGEFLMLSLKTKNNKFIFIRAEFQFTKSLPSLYFLQAGIQLGNSSRSILEIDGYTVGCCLHRRKWIKADDFV